MKKILFCTIIIALSFSCSNSSSNQKNEEVLDAYGPYEVDTTQALSIEEFFHDFEQKDSTETYTIKGSIVEICAKAGCWVGIDKGNGDYFMVRFKDHFTIPLDTKMQTEAYIHGVARWDSTTVEQLRFDTYAAGKSQAEIDAIEQPEYTFDFLADGIILIK